jgi:hypothetical protein
MHMHSCTAVHEAVDRHIGTFVPSSSEELVVDCNCMHTLLLDVEKHLHGVTQVHKQYAVRYHQYGTKMGFSVFIPRRN